MARSSLMNIQIGRALTDLRALVCLCLLAGLYDDASAQEAAPSTVVITLGTQGGPRFTNPERSQSANAIIVKGQPYLIDAGNGAARQLARAGITPLRIAQIFITHHHDDHNADLGTLMGLVWSVGVPRPITVFGPPGTAEFVAGFERSFAVNESIREADFPAFFKISPHAFFRFQEIGPAPTAKRVYEDANVRVDAIENCHYHFETAETKALSYAYRFTAADRVVVFSGDTGPCDSLVEFAKGADILVHEVINLDLQTADLAAAGIFSANDLGKMRRHMEQDHTTPEGVGRLAARAGVRMVVLTHLLPGKPSDPASAYSDGVSREFSGKVVVADDLMRF
jgi:ribonuclease BN (tRNA processing enzyme)